MASAAAADAVDYEDELHRIMEQGLRVSRVGGGGDVTKFVCGYLSCDRELSRILLAGLPGVFKVNIREKEPGCGWRMQSGFQWQMPALCPPAEKPY